MKTLEERFWAKVRDRDGKGRQATGERCGSAKLTDMQVFAIRVRGAMGEPQSVLAHDYGVTRQLIWQILHRKAWA